MSRIEDEDGNTIWDYDDGDDNLPAPERAVIRAERELRSWVADGDAGTQISDTLTDLRHLADKHYENFYEIAAISETNAMDEVQDPSF